MARTRSMTRNENLDVAFWSDRYPDLLSLVMMKLGVIDFVAFGGVCKAWRACALINRNRFMASIPPMLMSVSTRENRKECSLEDFEGRKSKTILPPTANSRTTFVGLACGYLIFFARRTRDFLLVNPITRHELRFPPFPFLYEGELIGTPILIFSPSISRWVFVIKRVAKKIWLSIEGEAWNHVSFPFFIFDLHAFKGKIYTIDDECRLYELRLDPESNPNFNLTLLETRGLLKPDIIIPKLVSSGENLFVKDSILKDPYVVRELYIGEMEWVPFEETRDEYAFFLSSSTYNCVASKKPELWADLWSRHRRYANIESGKARFFTAKFWYFPHEYMNVAWKVIWANGDKRHVMWAAGRVVGLLWDFRV